jgi:hypothetical protein
VFDGVRDDGRAEADGGQVDAVRVSLVGPGALDAAPQQRDGAARIASARMGQADGELRQALPQIAFGRWALFPSIFKDFMSMKRPACLQQFVCFGHGLGRAALDRGLRLAFTGSSFSGAAGERPAERIPRPGVARSASRIPVAIPVH